MNELDKKDCLTPFKLIDHKIKVDEEQMVVHGHLMDKNRYEFVKKFLWMNMNGSSYKTSKYDFYNASTAVDDIDVFMLIYLERIGRFNLVIANAIMFVHTMPLILNYAPKILVDRIFYRASGLKKYERVNEFRPIFHGRPFSIIFSRPVTAISLFYMGYIWMYY